MTKTILHVDDDKTIRGIVKLALEGFAGWKVSSVTSGEEALLTLTDETPDILLLDVMMPSIDGPTTFKLMKERRLLPVDLPVIFISAKALTRDEIEGFKALGAAGVIEKPFNPKTLGQQIQAIVAEFDERTFELEAAPETSTDRRHGNPATAGASRKPVASQAVPAVLHSITQEAVMQKIKDEAGQLGRSCNNDDPSIDMIRSLTEVAHAFSMTIPRSLELIENLLDGSTGSSVEGFEQSIMMAHHIRGSAGTLGMSAISASFAVLEDQLRLIREKCLYEDNLAVKATRTAIEMCKVSCKQEIQPSLDRPLKGTILCSAPLLTINAEQEEVDQIADESGQLVLLVEDDPVFISIVQAVLGSERHYRNGILSATTLSDAAKLLTESEPDIILLDLVLPDSSGIETFRKIQKLAPDVPILILTSLDDTPLADECVAGGAQDYLVKGRISPDALNRCIRYSINRFKAEKTMMRLQAIEDFNAALAHDLRVPVQGALRILEHILDGQFGPMNPQLKNALTILNDSNMTLLTRLNRLLNLYRLEFGEVELDWKQTNVVNVLAERIEARKPQLDGKQLKVRIDNREGNLEAFTDRHLLNEVIDELVENAIKFAPEGDTINISVEQKATKVAIKVSNQGKSIDQEEKKDLFKRFWRGTPGKSYVATSGLGLYYCHQVMNLLKGSIACRSNSDLTTFIVRLPSTRVEVEQNTLYFESVR